MKEALALVWIFNIPLIIALVRIIVIIPLIIALVKNIVIIPLIDTKMIFINAIFIKTFCLNPAATAIIGS